MRRMKIFLREPIHPEALALLERRAAVFGDFSRLSEADALITRNLKVTEALLARAEKLKVIGIHGTGVDDVDLAAAARRGIAVMNAPHLNSDAVAELIVLLALALSRRLCLADRMLRAEYPLAAAPAALAGTELRGKTLGLIGTGDIARKAAAMLKAAFAVRVVAFSRSLTPERAAALGMAYCGSVGEVLAQADILNIGVPLTPETDGMIGAAQLALARPTAILINTARGRVVDEDALYDALAAGRLAGAACDVFSSEPPTLRGTPLLSLDNFIATPHIGANTDEALRRVGLATVRQVLDVLDGKPARNLCRPDGTP